MDRIEIAVVRQPHAQGLALPRYMTDGAAAADAVAAIGDDLTILPGGRAAVPTGFAFGIPDGYEMQVRPRSGLARDHGISIVNAPGTVDSDYRDEVFVVLVNHGRGPFTVRRGERIAQLVIAPVLRADYAEGDALPPNGRGGFGSTGVGGGTDA